MPRFPKPVSVLSLITNKVLDFIYENHHHLVTEWNGNLLSPVALHRYAESISMKGAPRFKEKCDKTILDFIRSENFVVGSTSAFSRYHTMPPSSGLLSRFTS